MNRIDVERGQIQYDERGEGEAVFLVHAGVFGDWFAPLSETPALFAFRVIHVRRAGYGSNAATGHLSVADHARHIGALADRLSIKALHWVGHSSSCHMGLQLALERPDLVTSLVLLEPAGGGGLTVPASKDIGRRFIGPAMAAFAAGDIETAFDTFMRGVCGNTVQGGHRASPWSRGLPVCDRGFEILFWRRDCRRFGVVVWYGPKRHASGNQFSWSKAEIAARWDRYSIR